ncbi:hypothetical protein L1987_20188 [Smallanthus sonchifolius]|uniref:Uncharacterized protein n=1 Tax=Smallanthus sonchifolius TaxID=185202 RepID=A0ACB9IRC4_9ASTR|nr:hypothetical protein L1987_20188 [Smallanthus sonchifolius]
MYVFIHSLSHRKGGYDALSVYWGAIVLKICGEENFNLSYHIFTQIIKRAKDNKWLLYPRFIQMILNYLFNDLPPHGRPMTIAKKNDYPQSKLLLSPSKKRRQRKRKKSFFEKKKKNEKEQEPQSDDEEIVRKRKAKGKGIDPDAGKKKKQKSGSDGEAFMKAARDSYVRHQLRSPSRLKTPPPHGITEEDIESYRLARAALKSEGLPPSRQIQGTSGTRHSPPPQTHPIPPTGTPKTLKSMAKKKSKPDGKPVPPPIKESLDPELIKNVGIEASKGREDD